MPRADAHAYAESVYYEVVTEKGCTMLQQFVIHTGKGNQTPNSERYKNQFQMDTDLKRNAKLQIF